MGLQNRTNKLLDPKRTHKEGFQLDVNLDGVNFPVVREKFGIVIVILFFCGRFSH